MSSHADRLAACRRRLADVDADGIVCFPSRNLEYLTGFAEEPSERALFLFLTTDHEPVFFVPELAAQQIEDRTPVDRIRTWSDSEGPTEPLAELCSELGLDGGHLLVDETMWARFTQLLESILPNTTFGLADELLAELRIRKDNAELAALRRAATAADTAMTAVRELGSEAVGMTEAELASRIEAELTAAGGKEPSFELIVGSGANGAMPHHTHGDRTIESGDPVVLDFGTRVDGYPSDQTRTVVFDGEPSEEFKRVHDIVNRAQQAAIETVEPGMTAGKVDAAVREIIREAGYGEQFIHRTGHGVGLDIHEEPLIVDGSDRLLEPQMVFSVEPGVYLSGEFGVRIEDLVVVTQDGCERLNTTSREWRI
ncbi:Xaa-Pro aminopeptidase [Halohasta litchfieldiae]|jgi:Xaa-Pro aminopeptidase|uniref:Xaa-Pro aminopeptidase n=1 Tax=Halohasta litchfieldiae TaxID=1073996 RepID=A0A1H6RIL2_9EURY|nr:Xaa-Pro peptidase family protein [Halohasta litchfieldiae]ATW89810.1 Xaa-Pro aminopeptidase [Halohasta litchfieldiae]SEI52367.1 Xaa-Pro aminopeptidase [Halohasta litchfieldiae]